MHEDNASCIAMSKDHTPIQISLCLGNVDLVSALLHGPPSPSPHSIDVNQRDAYGRSLMHYALDPIGLCGGNASNGQNDQNDEYAPELLSGSSKIMSMVCFSKHMMKTWMKPLMSSFCQGFHFILIFESLTMRSSSHPSSSSFPVIDRPPHHCRGVRTVCRYELWKAAT